MHVASENETQNIAGNFTTLQSQDTGVEKKKKKVEFRILPKCPRETFIE